MNISNEIKSSKLLLSFLDSILIDDERPEHKGCKRAKNNTRQIRYDGKRYDIHRFVYMANNPEFDITNKYGSIIVRTCRNNECLNIDHMVLSDNQTRLLSTIGRNESNRTNLSFKLVFNIYWLRVVNKLTLPEILNIHPINKYTLHQIIYKYNWNWLTDYVDAGFSWKETERDLMKRGLIPQS